MRSVSPNKVSVIVNLTNSPTISKMKCKSNYLYLKMALVLSGDISLNPGPVTRHQTNDPKFEVFNGKGLHLIHLNINSLLPKIDELHNIAKCSNN